MNKGTQHQLLKQIPKGAKSWSGLRCWQTCKLQFWFKYGEKMPDAKGLPAKFGQAFHDARFRYFDHCRSIDKDSDWDAMEKIAHTTFHDAGLPLEYWDEYRAMARAYAEERSYTPTMLIEHRFGINRDESISTFEACDGFRGILDGLEIHGDTGTITDAKTSRTMDLAFTQLEVYASFMCLIYPKVKEWRLVYDFPRFRRITEKNVLAENLVKTREHVWSVIDHINAERSFKAQPSEECLQCSFLGVCDYRLKGVDAIESAKNGRSAIQEYWQLKARAEQIKRKLKKFVAACGSVSTDQSKADFYTVESKSCDKVALIKYLKSVGKNPVDYVTVPADSIKELMKDKTMSDDIGNFITIETKPVFDIKKIKEEEDGEAS